MKEIKIREATIQDLLIIQKFNQELCVKENKEYDSSINPNYPLTEEGEKYFRLRIEHSNSLALIAEENDVAIGYLVGSLIEAEEYRNIKVIAEAENMFVDSRYRGMGVGSKLTKKFEEWCTEKGVENIRYVASAENVDAIRFYESQGLKKINITLEKQLTK